MATSTFFNGRKLVTPQVASNVNDDKMIGQTGGVGQVLALIGHAKGGEPLTPLVIRSPSQARQVLRDDELMLACERAFAPSEQSAGADRVIALRVNPATQATLVLQDGSAGDVITLLSSDYGLYTNQIKVKIETGTNKGKKLTVQLDEALYTEDDIFRDAFTLQYTGAEATGTITVTNAQMVLEAPTSTVIATIDLNVYNTVRKLVDRIGSETDWVATVTAGSENTTSLNGLDGETDTDVKTALYTVTANLQAIIDWFDSSGEGYINATREAAALLVPANIDWTYLAAAIDGVTTNTQWQTCFTQLQNEDVQMIVPLSSDSSIWAMLDAHVLYMSTSGKMERRGMVGGPAGVTQAQAVINAAGLNSDRISYVYPGYNAHNDIGTLVTYPSYMTAALVAAGFVGINPGNTMTNKVLNVLGIEAVINEPTDTDALINGGVLAVRKTSQGIKVVKAVSTWLTNNNYNRIEVSTGVATDFVVRTVREALATFIGQKATSPLLQRAISTTDTILRQLARPEPAGPEVIIGDADTPAFRNLRGSVNGDVLEIEFQCSPAIPINFVLLSVHIDPFNTTSLVTFNAA